MSFYSMKSKMLILGIFRLRGSKVQNFTNMRNDGAGHLQVPVLVPLWGSTRLGTSLFCNPKWMHGKGTQSLILASHTPAPIFNTRYTDRTRSCCGIGLGVP